MLKKVLDAYPEFHQNLAAYAILKDSILIGGMSVIKSVKLIAKHYPVLIRSAEFVTRAIKEHIAATRKSSLASVLPSEDSLSDSSSSEGDSPISNQARASHNIRQISRDQLTDALILAGSSSLNSLSNIAQRNQIDSLTPNRNPLTPSTSSSNVAASTPSTSSSGLISNSFFSNALSNAMLYRQRPTPAGQRPQQQDATQQTQRQPSAANIPGGTDDENLRERFATELQTMREMGLTEDMINIQALVVSNGDVESAINLVLSGLGNFN